MIPSPPPRSNQQQQQQARIYPQNLADMARLHRLGRAYSHEGVINDIDIYYHPDEDGNLLNDEE